ncbi:hypothetical protein WA026_022705 [Henosepilachna vigintioctopunctata]|uniref:Uncharacterized protein n=1 Tax=Henosepilachna vigintioctopunctata TaxID=420089 RepID=A0AAW1TYM5_9CUCU
MMMTRIRVLSCSRYTNKIDEYDDTINRSICGNSFHITCVNVLINDFRALGENNCINKWRCNICDVRTVPGNGDQEIKDCFRKCDMEILLQDVISKIETSFKSKISTLKNLVTAQTEQISLLTREIELIKSKSNNNKSEDNKPGVRKPMKDNSTSAAVVSTHDPRSMVATNTLLFHDIINIEGDMKDNSVPPINPSESSEQWTVVENKRKIKSEIPDKENHKTHVMKKTFTEGSSSSRSPVIGISTSKELLSASKRPLTSIHLFRLHADTSLECVQNYISQTIPNVTCEKLKSKHPSVYFSFKLTLPSQFEVP